jgi:hypothetical protein
MKETKESEKLTALFETVWPTTKELYGVSIDPFLGGDLETDEYSRCYAKADRQTHVLSNGR